MEGLQPAEAVVVDVASPAATKPKKPSQHAEAADPGRYRVKDAVLFPCAAHSEAAVLCVTAGKTGRNGRTAAVGATVMWLTCPYINNMVARVERHGGVQTVARCVQRHEGLRARHIASHAVYARRVEELLEADQWVFFHEHFIAPKDAAARKFGNAAVSHEADLKCLHALVGQSLCGAANPLGDAVINYILFCHQLMDQCLRPGGSAAPVQPEDVRAQLQSSVLFDEFLEQTVAAGRDADGARVEVKLAWAAEAAPAAPASVAVEWVSDLGRLRQRQPDLCQCSLELATFVEGKAPTARRKHRRN